MIKYLLLILLLPVMAWPAQFGNTTVGTDGTTDYVGYMIWTKVTMGSSDGYLDSLTIYCWDATSPDDVKASIYTDAGDGTPNEPIDSTATTTMGSSAGWVSMPVIVGAKLKADSTYWLCAQSNSDEFNVKYNISITENLRRNAITPYVAWPNPADDDAGSSLDISFYGTYHQYMIIRTSSDGTYEESPWSGSLGNFEIQVDDYPTNDGASTQVNTSEAGATEKKFTVNMGDSTIPTGTIDSVRVLYILYGSSFDDADDSLTAVSYDGTDIEYGQSWVGSAAPSSYDTGWANFTTAPDGGTWTQTDITNIEFGLLTSHDGFGQGEIAYCTQLYAILYWSDIVESSQVFRRRRMPTQ